MGVGVHLFSLRGIATPLQALAVVLAYVVILVLVQVMTSLSPANVRFMYPVFGLATIAMLTTSVRRLHHAGQTGRWALLTLIPYLGIGVGFIIAGLPQRRTHLNAHNLARFAGYLGIMLILIWSIWRVSYAPYWIPSESMKPTLLVGDYLVAGQAGAKDILRGDVIVIRAHGQSLIKRVIAMPSDRVALQNGQVLINGAPLLQLPIGRFDEVMAPQGPDATRPRCENGVVGDGAVCSKSRYREVWPNGTEYEILNIEMTNFGDTFAEVTVPADTVFVLGDNRDNSIDSRYDRAVLGLGFVPFGDVVGPAKRILFSSSDASLWTVWTWRWDRLFRAIR